MTTFISRMVKEFDELTGRIEKLNAFVISDQFNLLPEVDRVDLTEQLKHMDRYREVLSRRLSRFAGAA